MVRNDGSQQHKALRILRVDASGRPELPVSPVAAAA
jgi:hypothetical protein